ncbi:diaminopimelate decarboxylase [Clostridium niameyense]|uniref:Diaminopimelate decarboxylase n=1 Tax=Clostridium niameyense TaxID=1622073 RepID=A0A6M0RC67_9CLOT|nr:diaminopimelate decarboxylase [Clostridium niameyense]NEZ46768.1 diaminopimelate decarboxylase [Clostridium niameyense]
MQLFGNMKIIDNTLHIGKVSTIELAKKFGTPLYIMDEMLIRKNCRDYINNFKVKELKNKITYAGKAFLTKAMCQIIQEEGLNLDVVSGGELYTAYKSKFPMKQIYFHGNNKTRNEIEMGIKLGVGRFVVDNFYELNTINQIAKKFNVKQKILLRLTPGIEAHTHDYIKTGQIDSKFGFTIVNDIYMMAIKQAIELSNVEFVGIHCHIGSQIFQTQPYEEEVSIMLNIIKKIRDELNIKVKELDLGGGFGIYYKDGDNPKTIKEFCESILKKSQEMSEKLQIDTPILTIEPGRSIVGNAGITLYSVGEIKEIPSVRKYIAVDGGMTDNIRPALYNSQYECIICNKVDDSQKEKVRIVGKCCESGDILIDDIEIPKVSTDDILAVLNTGAYGYSMASNYNKMPRPAVVLVQNNNYKLICRRETYEELISNETMI